MSIRMPRAESNTDFPQAARFPFKPGTCGLRTRRKRRKGPAHHATALDGGALQIDLKGYEGDRVIPHVVRLDFESEMIRPSIRV